MANPTGAAPTAVSSSSPSTSSLPPLPPGWTENKAPTGHTYYYNAQTRESTYRRPLPPPPAPPPPPGGPPSSSRPHLPLQPSTTYSQPFPSHPFPGAPQPGVRGPQAPATAPALRLSDPRVANAFMAQQNAANNPQDHHGKGGGRGGRGGRGGFGGRGGGNDRPRPQPNDKPRSRIPIPGHEPWVLVYTKYGRRFVYNSTKNTSYWRIPEKLMPAILEMDKAGIHKKVEAATGQKGEKPSGEAPGAAAKPSAPKPLVEDLDSDYEEVEVTDDEDGEEEKEDGAEDGPRKRQKTDEPGDEEMAVDGGEGGDGGPIEFSEADIAYQLAAAAAEYDDYDQEEWDGEEGEEGYDEGETEEGADGATLFKALLDDFKINPFSPWEKLIEEGKVFDDPRYTALPNMKARKAVWEEWSRDGIQKRKEQKAKEDKESAAKKDPRAPYLQLLQDHATPKLYWAEFKRKYRKEPGLKDSVAPHKEKDKEKMYRDYVARLKLSSSTRKSDLTKLLESLPLSALNNQTDPKDGLPHELTGDLRYIAVETSVRDALVEAFIRSAGPP
ncbi:hypothetical protein Sste5346_003370 [Sporothrix stenoceras]|uniref:WW domain-containing protein n=1 Tax=Sporothrix stenoceras TaxID=5173 RepID=A0ABR3ZE66_9PEZI